MDERFDCTIVGGGISGLTAAWLLARRGERVVVLEASDRVGGSIHTIEDGGFLLEAGPNTVLQSPAIEELIAGLRLESRRLLAATAAGRRYVWKADQLIPLPTGPAALLRTSLLSWPAKLRLLREPFIARAPAGAEESIAGFTRRRLGPEILRYAVGPFVSGVYAGDPEQLSMRFAM